MTAKQELRDRFAELYLAAGKPLYATVARHTRFNLGEAGERGALDEIIAKRRATAPSWSERDWRALWERARRRRVREKDRRVREKERPREDWALPPDTLAFTGRTDELEQIVTAARDNVVSIHAIDGMPGVGKPNAENWHTCKSTY